MYATLKAFAGALEYANITMMMLLLPVLTD